MLVIGSLLLKNDFVPLLLHGPLFLKLLLQYFGILNRNPCFLNLLGEPVITLTNLTNYKCVKTNNLFKLETHVFKLILRIRRIHDLNLTWNKSLHVLRFWCKAYVQVTVVTR
jgi:hypothetical protein